MIKHIEKFLMAVGICMVIILYYIPNCACIFQVANFTLAQLQVHEVMRQLFRYMAFHCVNAWAIYQNQCVTDGSLITSRLNPDRATHAKPGGSRIPDVVVVNDPSKPPTIGNVRRVYEMKIGDDDFTNILGPDGKTQLDAFKKLFGGLLYQDKSGYQALTDESCGCKDDDDDNGGDGLLSRAKAHADELARQQSAEFTKAAKALAVPVLRAASQIPGPIGAAARVLGLGMGAASLAN